MVAIPGVVGGRNVNGGASGPTSDALLSICEGWTDGGGGQDAFSGSSASAGWEGRHDVSDVVRDFGLTPASFYVKKKAKGHYNQIPMQLH